MTTPLILVIGATGTVGSEVVKQLGAVSCPVRVLVRDPAKASRFSKAVEVVVGDLENPDTLTAAFAGVNKTFVLSNGLDIARLESNAFTAAKRAGVKHIVKLSGRHLDAKFMAGTALAQAHNESEDRLRNLGTAWTIVRPGFFASNFRMLLDRSRHGVFLPVGQGRDTPTDPRDIAGVVVKTLISPGHEEKIYEITGPEFLSYVEMVQKIAVKIARPLQLVDVTTAEALPGLLAAGIPAKQADGLLRYFNGVKDGKIYPPTTTIADLLGRPARRFDEWLRDNLALMTY